MRAYGQKSAVVLSPRSVGLTLICGHSNTRWCCELPYSNQFQPLKARMPVAAHDDVVMHRDAERLCHLDDLPRHLDVGARRRRIAGGMVVDQTNEPATTLISLAFLE